MKHASDRVVSPDTDPALALGDEPAERTWQEKLGAPHVTLGQRLTQQAQALNAHRLPAMPWLHALQPVLERVTAQPVQTMRYQRREAPPRSVPVRATHRQEASAEDMADAWGAYLPSDVRQRLVEVVGPGVEAMRVHTDAQADAMARAHRADAVTVGRHVFFHADRFQPHQDRGFALLAHEAAHVRQAMQPNAAWRRATQAGRQVEEEQALALERDALHNPRRFARADLPLTLPAPGELPFVPGRDRTALPGYQQPPGPSFLPSQPHGATVDTAMTATPSAVVAQPMTAQADRPSAPVSPPTHASPPLEELRQALYRDLLRQLRTEFERGA